ncbi:MAG: pyridoxal-phosphate dependent enzyme [Nitrososphaerota archaeon]|nr:pyridoxal-phosphate dependent enzyme [Nitrososphaerota archaeon]
MQNTAADGQLLEKFDSQVRAMVPHLEGEKVANPTPLVEVTQELVECARDEYGLHLPREGVRVYAKLDSKISGGSVKVRPAVTIVRDAISSGKLARGQTVFEATSGNFGLALGQLGRLGLDVVAIVSRRLQPGVIDRLKADGVRLIDLDVDICPAPGLKGDVDKIVAKGVASNVRLRLGELGFDQARFDRVRDEAEEILAGQDAIGLAKLLARAYAGFCTEQYDNDLNAEAHRSVTAPEIDQQLAAQGASLNDVEFVCTFGTGGTASGVGAYISSRYGKKGVRVVFPLAGQDVAGIRTREKASGLRFYDPDSYVGVHEADFEEASRVFEYFNRKGLDVGESGALALYATIQLLNYGVGKRFIVMVADGASKYVREVAAVARRGKRDQVRLSEAASAIGEYAGVLWAHNTFVPRAEGIKVIASSLGCPESAVRVADTRDVQAVLNGREPSAGLQKLLPSDERPVLVICMAGSTSLMLAKVLERKGVAAESLVGGITGLPASKGRQPFDLVQIAR